MVVRQEILSSPDITPLIGGVLDHADVHEGMGWNEPATGLFESYSCMLTDRRATWPCPENLLPAPVQTALTSSAVGGALAAGTYYFTVTAINDQGETNQSNEQSVVLAGATSQVTVHWTPVPGAEGYNIYWGVDASEPKVKYAGMSELDSEINITGEFPADGGPAPTGNTAVIPAAPKVFDEGVSWPEGQRAVLYGGVDCKRLGGDDGVTAKITEVFERRESYGVERVLMETVLQGATDITPSGGAVSAKVGVALLEGHAAGAYAGSPTLHLPRTIASLLAGDQVIEAQGGKLYTRLGSKVAAGGGYDVSNIGPDGTPAAEGTYWLYASGEVVALRSAIIEKDALEVTGSAGLDSNTTRNLVERAYLVAVDCYTAAVLVNVE